MPLLYDFWPRDCPTLHNQTELSYISNDAFEASFAPRKLTTFQRCGQIVSFIFFCGWLRIILFFFVSLIFVPILLVMAAVVSRWRSTLGFGSRIGAFYGRCLLFCSGLYWIRVRGRLDPATRQLSYNHTSIMDGLMLYWEHRFTIALMAGVRRVPIVGWIMAAAEMIFIERTRTEGASAAISAGIRDHRMSPVAIAPEGKLSNGDIVFRFRTGGFLTDEQIQPVAIRYYRLLPALGCTLHWFIDSFWEYIFRVFCSPGYFAEVDFLEPITTEKLTGKTPTERADMTQLAIANHLGTLAINRTTKSFFQGDEKPKAE
jgi:1-acyl-sn-glycerol-3-phosphate acyltransferase